MSRPALLWCKLYSRLLDDDDFRGMSLVQRGVYVGLLCHVSKQEPRGTFSTKNLRDLANVVADGDEDALMGTLEYLQHEWLNAEGEPHLIAEGNRLRFRTFEDLQRAPSEEPEAVKARQDSYKERNNGNKTDDKRNHNGNKRSLEGEGEGDKEGEGEKKQITEGVRGNRAAASAISLEVGLVTAALGIDRPTDRQVKRLTNGLNDQKYRHLNGEMVADAYAEWQDSLAPPGKQHKDRIGGFLNQLEMRREQPAYFREAPPSSNGTPPSEDVPMTPEELHEYIAARTTSPGWHRS